MKKPGLWRLESGLHILHGHADTDESFIVLDREMQIDFRDGKVSLKAGEMLVVPKGVEHKPFAENECQVMKEGAVVQKQLIFHP